MALFRVARRTVLALAASLSMPRTNPAVAETGNADSLRSGGLVEDLERIRAWIERNAPPGFFPIYRPPVSMEEIERAERQIGVGFHPDLRTLLSFTDGVTENAPTLADAFNPMPLAAIVDAYDFLYDTFPEGRNVEHPDHAPIDADPGIRSTWWWPGWIPFMENGGGDYLCIDMDPAPGGTRGQVIAYYHDETFRSRNAPDIGSMFATIADGLEAGTYELHPENRMIAEKHR